MKKSLIFPIGGTLLLAGVFFFALNAFLLDNPVAPDVAHAASLTSARNGNWSAGSTWSTGAVPGSADSVTIAAG